MAWTRDEIAARAALEIGDEWVNLGAGIPARVADHLPAQSQVRLHENGALRLCGPSGTTDRHGEERMAYFGSAETFEMIRGGHVGLCMLGAMQVAGNGDMASWIAPGRRVAGIGGAMDLVAGCKRVIVLMEQVEKSGARKLVSRCSLPLTGARVVDLLITDLGVFDVNRGRSPLMLKELAPGVTVDEVRAKSEAAFGITLA